MKLIKNINKTKALSFLLLITTIYFPYMEQIRPFHLCLALLPLILYGSFDKKYIFISLILIIIQQFITIIYLNEFLVKEQFFTSLPLVFYLISYSLFKNTSLEQKALANLINIISIIAVFFIIIQVFFPNTFLAKIIIGHVTENRFYLIQRFSMLMAPFQNPNNAGFIFAFIFLINQFIFIKHRKLFGIKNIFTMFFLTIGIVLSYGRTVIGALIFVECLIFVFKYINLKYIYKTIIYLSIILILMISLYLLNFYYIKNDRLLTYYFTILSFWEDKSFTNRFYYWNNCMDILKNYKFGYIIGIPFYKQILTVKSGSNIVDSNYIYILISYGFFGMLLFFSTFIDAIKRERYIIFMFIFVLISSTTLPFLSDYRIALSIGILIGITVSLNKKNINNMAYEYN